MIVGLGAISTCPACRRSFTIVVIQHDGRTGEGTVGLGVVPTPGEAPALPAATDQPVS